MLKAELDHIRKQNGTGGNASCSVDHAFGVTPAPYLCLTVAAGVFSDLTLAPI